MPARQLRLVATGEQFSVFVRTNGNLMIEDANFEIVADFPAPSELLDILLGPDTEELPVVRVP